MGMEYFGSRDENTQNVSLGEVDQCDLYVGIFGGRYGSGITEAEYQKASKLSLPCFIYFKEEACIPSDLWENVPDKAERLKALKNALCQNHTITIFTTPDDLATKLTADLHNWFFDMYIVQGIESFHKVYAARIQNFMNEYLGTLKHPVPFGGRNIDLSLLDKWFDGPEQPPYLLLSAPAGRGKSAMLARWSKQLSRRDNVEVVFFPVSIRFRTNLASIVFSSMTARLSLLYGTPVSVLPDITIEMWRGMMTEFLSRPFPDGRTLLLILDGVDEAADWEPGPDLFPSSPGKGVHVIVSARYLAGDVDSSGWMHRLGWHHQNLASSMDLSPLTQEGVADALNSMGFPLDQLGRRVDIIAELHRLSEGDPLLVRLYVDDLLVGGDSTARLQPEDLYSI
ncbi:MAG: hypothetical protein QG588_723, partial [Candidatus Poribacteria bacterium]|nr:hypothetical protein [Candidatus Poribacteria bacterium]